MYILQSCNYVLYMYDYHISRGIHLQDNVQTYHKKYMSNIYNCVQFLLNGKMIVSLGDTLTN